MRDDEVIEFAYDVAKLKLLNFCICGGEPLLRFELMCKIGEILKRCGF